MTAIAKRRMVLCAGVLLGSIAAATPASFEESLVAQAVIEITAHDALADALLRQAANAVMQNHTELRPVTLDGLRSAIRRSLDGLPDCKDFENPPLPRGCVFHDAKFSLIEVTLHFAVAQAKRRPKAQGTVGNFCNWVLFEAQVTR